MAEEAVSGGLRISAAALIAAVLVLAAAGFGVFELGRALHGSPRTFEIFCSFSSTGKPDLSQCLYASGPDAGDRAVPPGGDPYTARCRDFGPNGGNTVEVYRCPSP